MLIHNRTMYYYLYHFDHWPLDVVPASFRQRRRSVRRNQSQVPKRKIFINISIEKNRHIYNPKCFISSILLYNSSRPHSIIAYIRIFRRQVFGLDWIGSSGQNPCPILAFSQNRQLMSNWSACNFMILDSISTIKY